ncbi:MAG: GGDEF domain-containing protein [Xanthomonadales bacterium]|nr:GGDEF domain-containing protein [Xanthomonadales bacterium]
MYDKLLNSLVAVAPAACLAGWLLATGFRRNRVVWLLMLLAIDTWDWIPPGRNALADLLAPALALWVAVRPERPLLGPRSVALAAGLALALWLAGQLGEGGAARLLGWRTAAISWPAGFGAIATLYLLAAAACLVHWWRLRGAADAGAAAALVCAALAGMPGQDWMPPPAWLTLGVSLAIGGVLMQAFRMAFVDPLTGLPNRRALDEHLARSEGRLAVAMVDVDHFKRFNDRHGHDAGDLVLRIVARTLKRCRGGQAFRYGGEEFSILFASADRDRVSEALDQVRRRVQDTRVKLGRGRLPKARPQAIRKGAAQGEVHVTVSIGMATRGGPSPPAQNLIEAADRALYKAKQAGRNRVVVAAA